jgi:hypothetical protein
MISRLRAFGAFWYDFVIGDDWRVALGVALTLASVWVLARVTDAPLWWLVPVVVAMILPMSLRRAIQPPSPSSK